MAKATATERGYFGVIREPGETFDVPDGTESCTWFNVSTKKTRAAAAVAAEAATTTEPETATEGRASDQSVI